MYSGLFFLLKYLQLADNRPRVFRNIHNVPLLLNILSSCCCCFMFCSKLTTYINIKVTDLKHEKTVFYIIVRCFFWRSSELYFQNFVKTEKVLDFDQISNSIVSIESRQIIQTKVWFGA